MRCAKTPPPYGRGTNGGDVQWKVLVVDETSRKLIDNAVSEDDILNLNVTSKPGISIDNESHRLMTILARCRADRGKAENQPYGCAVYPIAPITYCRLPDGRL